MDNRVPDGIVACVIFVAGDACYDERMIFVKKTDDLCLRGYFDLPMEKMEDGESIENCASRICHESLGVSIGKGHWIHVGKIHTTRVLCPLHVVAVQINKEGLLSIKQNLSNNDMVVCISMTEVLSRRAGQISPRLYYLIPKAFASLEGFEEYDGPNKGISRST